jgi:hypothetical protein
MTEGAGMTSGKKDFSLPPSPPPSLKLRSDEKATEDRAVEMTGGAWQREIIGDCPYLMKRNNR